MTKKTEAKIERNHYSTEFKQQALLRAVKDGIAVAARELGLEAAQLYAWRSKDKQQSKDDKVAGLQQAKAVRFEQLPIKLEQVAQLLTQGHSCPEIAKKLGKSETTVRNQQRDVAQRLGVARQSEIPLAYTLYREKQGRAMWPDFSGVWWLSILARKIRTKGADSAPIENIELLSKITLERDAKNPAKYHSHQTRWLRKGHCDERSPMTNQNDGAGAGDFDGAHASLHDYRSLAIAVQEAFENGLELDVCFDPSAAPNAPNTWRTFTLKWLDQLGVGVARAMGRINQQMNRMSGDLWRVERYRGEDFHEWVADLSVACVRDNVVERHRQDVEERTRGALPGNLSTAPAERAAITMQLPNDISEMAVIRRIVEETEDW